MAFFPANFMLHHHQDDHQHQHQHQPSPLLNSILTSCAPQDYNHGGAHGFVGKRSMSFSVGIEDGSNIKINNNNNNNGEEEMSEDDDGLSLLLQGGGGGGGGEKKRRLNMEQVKTLEKSFELGNKLEPERKMQLARALGLQPRQIAIWFQNRRARWKTKQLEKDYDLLKRQYDAVKADNHALQAHNQKLHTQILALKSREATVESINLNKETEGSSSIRSENSSDIKLDMPTRTEAEAEAEAANNNESNNHQQSNMNMNLFPSTSVHHQLLQTSNGNSNTSISNTTATTTTSSRPTELKIDHMVKEESLSNMFCSIDDQSGLWPWLEHQHFN